jgi:hypothetical protein
MFENNDSNSVFYSNQSNTNSSNGSNFLMNTLLILLIVLVIINVLYYYFGIDVIGGIRNSFYNIINTRQIDINVVDKQPVNDKPSVKINVTDNGKEIIQSGSGSGYGSGSVSGSGYGSGSGSKKEQVFNIPGNYYDYSNAKAVCNAYGARLAKYDEIESAYKNGGEWCNYGWSEGQMALFPTQQKTFDSLQKVKGHEHDCGRPGVNGGYIANPDVRFGANCYGSKPHMSTEDEEYMENVHPIPQTPEDAAFQKKVDYWKTQTNEMIVAPFNYNTWSKF